MIEKAILEHDHLSGKFRGWACQSCNSQMKLQKGKLPIFFHNLTGYDSHHIMLGAASVSAKYKSRGERFKVDTIPQGSHLIQLKFSRVTAEKLAEAYKKNVAQYRRDHPESKQTDDEIMVNVNMFPDSEIIIRDSMRFFGGSLDSNVEALGKDKCYITNKVFENLEPGRMAEKMDFPYEYVKFENLSQPPLPPIESFTSTLTKKPISTEDYDKVASLVKDMECETFEETLLAYNLCDVTLLADVMEDFRNTAYNLFALDPLRFTGLPAFGWQSMLRMTKVQLEPLRDIEMVRMWEKARRGGICFINNKRHMNVEGTDSHMEYLDMNSLYPSAMSYPMPIGGFEWIEGNAPINFETEDYIIEVDIYPPSDHAMRKRLKNYPLLPEVRTVNTSELTEYQRYLKKAMIKKRQISFETGEELSDLTLDEPDNKCEKLICDFNPKFNYVMSRRTLFFANTMGYVVTKVHRILKFKTSNFMQNYINTCVAKRTVATSNTEKDMWKLCMNAVYGKSLEDVFKQTKNVTVLDIGDLDKEIRKPSFSDVIDSNGIFTVTHHDPEKEYNRPTYVGIYTLDISKLLMAEFFYKHIEPHGYELLYQDTDSFIFVGNRCYKDIMKAYMECGNPAYDVFDVSNLKAEWVTDEMRKRGNKQLGRMKSEIGDKRMMEFCALRPKAYAYRCEDGEQSARAKGVTKVVRKQFNIEHYTRTLYDEQCLNAEQTSIRSFDHQLTTFTSRKTALSPYYDKARLLDAINVEPYGN